MPTIENDWIKSEDGLRLRYRCWHPHESALAEVFLVHGYNEHSGRYEHVAAAINAAGYRMHAIDLRGHGESEGARGHTPSLEQLLLDVDLLIKQGQADLPNFLYGHSLGGSIALNYALAHQPALKGVITTAPWLRLAFVPSKFQVLLAKMMVTVWPTFSQDSNLEVEFLSRDPQVVEAYVNDPLIHDRITAQAFLIYNTGGERALERASQLDVPLLLIHGAADRLIDPKASQDFFQRASVEDKTLHMLPDLYHEVHNEPEQDQVLKLVTDWIASHT